MTGCAEASNDDVQVEVGERDRERSEVRERAAVRTGEGAGERIATRGQKWRERGHYGCSCREALHHPGGITSLAAGSSLTTAVSCSACSIAR